GRAGVVCSCSSGFASPSVPSVERCTGRRPLPAYARPGASRRVRPTPHIARSADMTHDATRRTVLVTAGAAGAAALAAACGGGGGDGGGDGGDTGSGTVTSTAGPDAPGAPDLARAGDVPVGGGTVLKDEKIVVTQPTAAEFKAFSAGCTHQHCLVSTVADGAIDCPCHGSRFRITDGSVERGPATQPLPEERITVDGNSIRTA